MASQKLNPAEPPAGLTMPRRQTHQVAVSFLERATAAVGAAAASTGYLADNVDRTSLRHRGANGFLVSWESVAEGSRNAGDAHWQQHRTR